MAVSQRIVWPKTVWQQTNAGDGAPEGNSGARSCKERQTARLAADRSAPLFGTSSISGSAERAADIQTFRFDEAKGRGVDGGASPDLKVVLYPIDTGIPEINLRFGYDQIGDEFFTPRHRHNFDQFRYVVSGEMNIAKGVDLHEGECAYFPEGTHYGPFFWLYPRIAFPWMVAIKPCSNIPFKSGPNP